MLRRPVFRPSSAFSLVELLVVMGIIAVLIAILLPVLSQAQAAAQSARCKGQLRELASFMNMYLNENKQRVPRVNPTPSIIPPLVDAPSIVEVLEPYFKTATGFLRCPSDLIMNRDPNSTTSKPDAQTWFEREGISYEYNFGLNAFSAIDPETGVNMTWNKAIARISELRNTSAERIQVFRDFDPFHDSAGKPTSRNYLYADWSIDVRRDRP